MRDARLRMSAGEAKIKQAIELFYKNKFSESDGDPHKTGHLII